MMVEIRFHGRGGQGAVVASELLAQAAFLDGREPQSFPFFGVERRGAPVTAYARIDDRPVRVRTAIDHPNIVVVLDPGLLTTVPVTEGLRSEGLLLVNSRLPPEQLAAPSDVRRAAVDANAIAIAHGLGSAATPIVNTAMLGALARSTGVVSLRSLQEAIDRFVPRRRAENRQASAEGFASVRVTEPTGAVLTVPAPLVRPSPPIPDGPVASLPSAVIHTAAWRTQRPVVHLEKCTRCNFCWKFCPDDAFEFDAAGYPVVRLDYCKGCGICAEECPPKVIEMVAEA
jgi:2-oxoacid:acceptor oxidoreductase gamma subunit (pyruvate/2-ketoisovalerate family)/2-oxoacid:acceptor oxidoreductase delta subunit (pyruvate/2-ketoisovalerate family)